LISVVKNKRLLLGAFLMALLGFYFASSERVSSNTPEALYWAKISGEMIEFDGVVSTILKDDEIGSRHQRIILKRQKLTLLLAHNIDLADRIPVEIGDKLTIYGQYEWNEKGGVVHWTHEDPAHQHPAGWIKHKGIQYGALKE